MALRTASPPAKACAEHREPPHRSGARSHPPRRPDTPCVAEAAVARTGKTRDQRWRGKTSRELRARRCESALMPRQRVLKRRGSTKVTRRPVSAEHATRLAAHRRNRDLPRSQGYGCGRTRMADRASRHDVETTASTAAARPTVVLYPTLNNQSVIWSHKMLITTAIAMTAHGKWKCNPWYTGRRRQQKARVFRRTLLSSTRRCTCVTSFGQRKHGKPPG